MLSVNSSSSSGLSEGFTTVLVKSLSESAKKYFQLVQNVPGFIAPLGATPSKNGINFAIHSTSETMNLRIYQDVKNKPIYTLKLDSTIHKTGNVWHVFVDGLPKTNLYYSYENELSNGKDILDPYAKGVISRSQYGIGDNGKDDYSYRPIGAIIGGEGNVFEWEGDEPLNRDKKDMIIYEMHVRGFTKHHSSKLESSGTFASIIDKIEYFKSMGINTIELQPIHEFNEMNYGDSWGYNTVNFFSPMNRYGRSEKPQDVVNEFKMMVKELHKNGIEVILDVVFNHTGEGNEHGPQQSFKSLDKNSYYMINNDGYYINKSGCGNTLNCNNPTTKNLILDSLKYWVQEMHVDGFRFDLASVFNRDSHGNVIYGQTPILDAISNDPVLKNTKLIAEPWDTEMQQLGAFTSHDTRWQEWNGNYRDAARSYLKGEASAKKLFAGALCGSETVFKNQGGSPLNSINFVTAHDGFTLKDLVSYNGKHNYANGDENRDGCDNNLSWNCGIEGGTDDQLVLRSRRQQMRNLHLALMVSTGTPMVLMGDEYGHTKNGNNNTYKLDELNQFNWDKLSEDEGFNRFFGLLNQYRLSNEILRKDQFLTGKDIVWHGANPYEPNWDDPLLSFTLKGTLDPEEQLNLAFNASNTPITLTLPEPPIGKQWHVVVNTSVEAPYDFISEENTEPLCDREFVLYPYSSIMLEAKQK